MHDLNRTLVPHVISERHRQAQAHRLARHAADPML